MTRQRNTPHPLVAELRRHRLAAGLSQRAVADAMGTAQSAVCDIEAGRSRPRIDTFARYAAAVGLVLNLTNLPEEADQ